MIKSFNVQYSTYIYEGKFVELISINKANPAPSVSLSGRANFAPPALPVAEIIMQTLS